MQSHWCGPLNMRSIDDLWYFLIVHGFQLLCQNTVCPLLSTQNLAFFTRNFIKCTLSYVFLQSYSYNKYEHTYTKC